MISTEAEILRYFPSPPAPLPEGEGRKKIPENFCFSQVGWATGLSLPTILSQVGGQINTCPYTG